MSECVRKALPEVRGWLGVSLGCLGEVGRPSQISGSGRETLPNVREWWEPLPDVWQLSGNPSECSREVGGPFGCSRVVWRPSRMSGSGREALLDVRDALPHVWEWSEDSLG